MDQKTFVLYLHMKGMELNVIHEDLVRTLGEEAVTCSIVTKYVLKAQFARKTEAITPEPADG
jgi:hypothetical protein